MFRLKHVGYAAGHSFTKHEFAKKRATPYASSPKHNHETIANSQTGKIGWRKSAATPVNTCYKNSQPVSGVAKIGKFCGKHKKTEGKHANTQSNMRQRPKQNTANNQEKSKNRGATAREADKNNNR